MKRISLIPYGDISLLSLASISPGTKFRLLSKVKEITDEKIVVFDDENEHSFSQPIDTSQDIQKDDVIVVFGMKEEESIKIEKIIKMNLDWAHLVKVQGLEQM